MKIGLVADVAKLTRLTPFGHRGRYFAVMHTTPLAGRSTGPISVNAGPAFL
jgi:hypothetical protein